ncbi:hypothetical protein M9Y10_032231 [Tritrichomonas musculus]|uniref:NAD(P)-binding domain-containing protein n=1 Tax=Tritrichomonas musculus TaxID=1915356 RepID=A0ABR2H075_9EUKA
MENSEEHYNVIVIGATGASGRELVDELLNSPYYSTITIPVRRKIDRWENLPKEKADKLIVKIVENLDFLFDEAQFKETISTDIQYNTLFCCLGSRVGRGEEEFRKVDFTYPVKACEICEKLKIPHFSLISAGNAKTSSMFLYCRVKGEAEDEIMKKDVQYISIMRPGIILDRDNDKRTSETFMAWVPFVAKISTKDIAKALLYDDLLFQREANKEPKKVKIEHAQMEKLASDYSASLSNANTEAKAE